VIVYQWAARHGVPLAAVNELLQMLGARDANPPDQLTQPRSEAWVQQQRRLQLARCGGLSWRNNVGAYRDDRGAMVRYGLCNDSKELNQRIKSSDLIEIVPVLIGPEHLGTTIGQFSATECKEQGWRYTATPHEQAQLAFGELVLSRGGLFQFYNGDDIK